MGVRIRGTLGDIDPLNKVPFKRARSRVKKSLKGTLKAALKGTLKGTPEGGLPETT